MGLLIVTYDGIVGEPVKKLKFVMIKRSWVQIQWSASETPSRAPPSANELDFGGW
jgi:hypothetical protein